MLVDSTEEKPVPARCAFFTALLQLQRRRCVITAEVPDRVLFLPLRERDVNSESKLCIVDMADKITKSNGPSVRSFTALM